MIGPITCKPSYYVNLGCKVERVETEADTIMSRPQDSVNRTGRCLLYKGTAWRWFKDKQQPVERQASNLLPVHRRPSNTKPN